MLLDAFRKHRVGVVALCSYGRSGTTAFMQILRAAGVTVLGGFPFEERTAQASLLHWLHQGFGPPAHELGGFGRVAFHNAQYAAPWFAQARSYEDVRQAEAALAEAIVAAAPRPGARWLGEKFLGFETIRLCRAFDLGNLVLPVFLLRDPRAVFVSIKRFNARRGVVSFNDSGDDARLFQVICQFEERQVKEQARLGGLLLRYEALMAREARDAALSELMQALRLPGLPAEVWAKVDAERAQAAHHITSDAGPETGYAPVFATQAEALARLGYPEAA